MVHLTLSIPTFNDAESIGPLVEAGLAALRRLTGSFRILVIDDGSRDDTVARVRGLMAVHPEVELVVHPRNLGFGAAIRDAYLLPVSEWVICLPGDGQVPAGCLARLYPFTSDHRLVLGTRRYRRDPWRRRVQSAVYNRLVSILARQRVRDVNDAALVHQSLLTGLHLTSASAFVFAELFLECLRRGTTWCEIEIEHRPRQAGRGAGGRVDVILATCRELFLYALKRGRVPRAISASHARSAAPPSPS